MSRPLALALAGLLLCIALSHADEALRRKSVFIEGEDFEPVGAGWTPGQGWADDIYEATSGNAVLGNNGDRGEARKAVAIPAAGVYSVWARYLKIGAYTGTFGVRVEQGGKVVFDQQYRTKPEGGDWRPMWEKFPATLAAGPATVTVYLAQPGIRQRLDCVLITPDPNYQPDYHDFAPQVFLRFRLLDPPEAVAPPVTTYQHRAPTYYGEAGALAAADGKPVPPGQWSAWRDVSKWMDSGKWLTTVKLRFLAGGKPLAHVKADLQVSPEADEVSAKTFHEDIDGEIVTLVLPGDLRKFPDVPALASEVSARHLATARSLNLPPPAPGDTGIPLELWICGYGDSYRSARVLKDEMETARLLGANAMNDLFGLRRQIAEGLGVRQGFLSDWVPYEAWACPTSEKLPAIMDEHFAKIAADIRQEDPGALDHIYRNILQDEPGTSDLKHMRECPSCLAAFRRFLQDRGLAPDNFGAASWDAVKPISRDQATDGLTRQLYTWSIRFRDTTNAELVRQGRLAAEKHLGAHVLNCVNFTDGPLSGWTAAMTDGPDWFLYGRMKAVSIMWSEDWASLGPEVSGYIVDTLRAAARPSSLPVGEYIICNQLPTLEQRAFSALMHGARCLHFYCYGPYYAFADGMVSDNPDAQRAVGVTLRKIAKAGPYLKDARPAPAQVALLYGKSHEIWQDDAAVGTERRSVYLALQHAHVPVDIVSEDDLADGVLRGYKALYVTESNVPHAAAAKIAEWVRGGGVLQLCAGAGLRDEYNAPLAELLDLCGVTVASVDKPKGDYREHYGIHYTQPSGEIALAANNLWGACKLPLLGYREHATAAGAEVLATFAEGKPAAFERKVGKGVVVRFAFMPGLGYVKSADPGPDRLTTGYRPEQLPVLTAAVKLAGVTSPLVLRLA